MIWQPSILNIDGMTYLMQEVNHKWCKVSKDINSKNRLNKACQITTGSMKIFMH